MTAIFVIAALLGSSQHASADGVHLVATINGSGRAADASIRDIVEALRAFSNVIVQAMFVTDAAHDFDNVPEVRSAAPLADVREMEATA